MKGLRAIGGLMAALLMALAFGLAGERAAAQSSPAPGNPFATGVPGQNRAMVPPKVAQPAAEPAGPVQRAWAWLYQMQADFHRALIDAVKRFRTADVWTATWWLAIASFGYGIFHAAGPGHGKAVISSYVLADGRTVRRGVALAFLAALIQALSALLLVGVLKFVFDAAGVKTMQGMENRLETLSWAFVTVIGAFLLYRQVRPLLVRGAPALAVGGHGHVHIHGRGGGHHGHDHDHHHGHQGHARTDAQGEACAHCGHAHLPSAAEIGGDWSWRRALALAFAVGIRPCTGAILVLIFAISQGLLWTGVVATFAMALGTAITVSLLAAFAVGARELTARLAGVGDARWTARVQTAAGVTGAALVLGLGLSFFLASLNGTGPF